jgi:uncharacterized membrane protein YdbT with pleckstrin-like domain
VSIEVTHSAIMALLVIFAVVTVGGLAFIAWIVRDVSRMTRAVGALVTQETGKLRRD